MSGDIGLWHVLDNLRNQYNPVGSPLRANGSAAEAFTTPIDATADRFVLRHTGINSLNEFGQSYFFMSFADVPAYNALAS